MRATELPRSLGEATMKRLGRLSARVQERRSLPADLLESDDAFLAVFDVPGADPGEIQVQYDAGLLWVRADRFREHHPGYEMRFPGRGLALDGRLRLPADAHVDPEAATAELREDGTLRVWLPRTDEESAVSVPIEPETAPREE